jgi:hypothetical protein
MRYQKENKFFVAMKLEWGRRSGQERKTNVKRVNVKVWRA